MGESRAMNIYEKLAKIRKSVEVVQKNKSGYGYKYVTDDELFARITGAMEKYNVSLIPSVIPGTATVTPYRYDKMKVVNKETRLEPQNEIIVQAEMSYSWVNNENPDERVAVPWILVGQQSDASQAFGSGLTYSMRYFLLKYFSVATPEDDPDNWRSKQKSAEAAEEKAIAESLMADFDAEFRSWLAANPDKREEAIAFFKGFEKNGNYKNITDARLAAKMRADFAAKFYSVKED